MKKLNVGNIKFTKPVVEKLVDIHYVEFDKPLDDIISKLDGKDIKLLVVDETVMVDFGDENIEKHLDTKIFYDEEWIKKHNPQGDFNLWLVEFVDQLILAGKRKC